MLSQTHRTFSKSQAPAMRGLRVPTNHPHTVLRESYVQEKRLDVALVPKSK